MNHKITFQELVDAIAEQSGKSEQFTHDFIKDLVSIIQKSLEKDGDINIAGLGKFELKKMDEREGFNPQTEEKITIPAHNKIDFSPYKDLRELVNAPYAHMEPEVIEEEPSDSEDLDEQEEHDIIPPSTPEDADEEPEKKKAPWEEDMESELDVDEDDPFGLNAKRTEMSPFSFDEEEGDEDDDSEDIVEFTPDIEPEPEEESGDKETSEAESTFEPEEDIDIDESEEEAEPEELSKNQETTVKEDAKFTPKSTPSFRDRRHRKRDSGNGRTFQIIAAAFIILLLAIGAWYFMDIQQSGTPESMDTQTAQSEMQAEQQQERTQAAETQQEQEAEEEQPSAADDTQQPASGQQQAGPGQQSTQPDNTPPVETITIAEGQTLWGLADNHYENPYLWPWIYDTNRSSIDNPDIIIIGQSLDIPLRRGSNNNLSENDSLQVALGYIETYKWYKENNLENAKFYLYAAKTYYNRIFEYTDEEFDEADIAFANRAQ